MRRGVLIIRDCAYSEFVEYHRVIDWNSIEFVVRWRELLSAK